VPPQPFGQPPRDRRPPRPDRLVFQEAAQVVGHFLRRGVAFRRLACHRLLHDGFQVRGDAAI